MFVQVAERLTADDKAPCRVDVSAQTVDSSDRPVLQSGGIG